MDTGVAAVSGSLRLCSPLVMLLGWKLHEHHLASSLTLVLRPCGFLRGDRSALLPTSAVSSASCLLKRLGWGCEETSGKTGWPGGQPWPVARMGLHQDGGLGLKAPELILCWAAGYYFTGDGAHRTQDGYYQITGRIDDVINISGHRLGTAEIEDAMVSAPSLSFTLALP